MIRSSFYAGQIIESALKRAHMMPPGKYGLTLRDTYFMYDQSLLEVLKIHFETDKEQFYEPRAVQARTNGKFAAAGGSYDSATEVLTITMSPLGSSADVGEVITLFDPSVTPARFFAGTILAFISPNKYQIALSYTIPDLATVVNVTVGDWLITGDVITILQPNEILAPENLDIYDISNNQKIEDVGYEEFNYRGTLSKFKSSDIRWCRYMQTRIEFASGTLAPPLGTLKISAYWVPPKTYGLGSPAYISDKRVGEVEERLILKLLSLKSGTPVQEPNVLQAEMAQTQLADKGTKESQAEVR